MISFAIGFQKRYTNEPATFVTGQILCTPGYKIKNK